MNIIEAIGDKKLFGQLFKNPATWSAWRVFLRGLFGLPMDGPELEVFKQLTGRTAAPSKQAKEAFAIVGRRGGKSFISAVVACYLGLFHDWKPYLAPGEAGYIMIIANDRIQARVIFGYIRAILALPMFKTAVERELAEEVRLNNGVIISVKTCDFRTLRGFTVLCAVCDEMAYWRSEGANPAQEILTALRPALATVPGSLLLGISSPYSKSGPLYEAFRSKYGQDDADILVMRAPTRMMNPTINEKIIERALADDYSAAKAEWLAEFREDLETFLTTEMITGAIIPGRFELPKLAAVEYFAFVDPSGGRADSFTMAIAHREGSPGGPAESGRIVLDRLEEKRPPFGPQDVARDYADIMKSYSISRCQGDKYAGEWVTKAFADAGIIYDASSLNKSEIYLEFEPLIAQRRVDLLDHPRMFQELRGLERRTRSGGRDLIDHYTGAHDDLANAAAGACVMAAKDDGAPAEIIWLDGPEPDGLWQRVF